jgi:hypothetical protein
VAIYESLTTFAGLPVKDWKGAKPPAAPGGVAVRLRVDYDEASDGVTFGDKLAELLEADGSSALAALVVGSWTPDDTSGDSTDVVDRLVAARDRLPNLRHLFLGDITAEECEISWIRQSDLSPLLAAYDRLETLAVRGGDNLSFASLRHPRLTNLTIQAGGLPPEVVRAVGAADLPALTHLELWLGSTSYGGDATVDDLAPILRGDRFPSLRYLGIKDSEIQDAVAAAVAASAIVARLHTLDLSMGTLGDAGAKALLASPAVRKLARLDLHHHYISEPVQAQLRALGIDVDLSEAEDASESADDRYVAVSE